MAMNPKSRSLEKIDSLIDKFNTFFKSIISETESTTLKSGSIIINSLDIKSLLNDTKDVEPKLHENVEFMKTLENLNSKINSIIKEHRISGLGDIQDYFNKLNDILNKETSTMDVFLTDTDKKVKEKMEALNKAVRVKMEALKHKKEALEKYVEVRKKVLNTLENDIGLLSKELLDATNKENDKSKRDAGIDAIQKKSAVGSEEQIQSLQKKYDVILKKLGELSSGNAKLGDEGSKQKNDDKKIINFLESKLKRFYADFQNAVKDFKAKAKDSKEKAKVSNENDPHVLVLKINDDLKAIKEKIDKELKAKEGKIIIDDPLYQKLNHEIEAISKKVNIIWDTIEKESPGISQPKLDNLTEEATKFENEIKAIKQNIHKFKKEVQFTTMASTASKIPKKDIPKGGDKNIPPEEGPKKKGP